MHRDALELLYQTHYRAALLYTLALCGSRERAEDIVSQAFETAMVTLTMATQEDERTGFRPWLLTVCKHLWIDELRREKRRHPEPVEKLGLASVEDGLDQLLKEERHGVLYRAISRLPVRSRELVTLYYFGDLSLRDIASVMHMTSNAAKTALCRARCTLRKLLEEDGYEF